jgi:hypothetical protein
VALPFKQREDIARALGLIGEREARKLAVETGAVGVGRDPDYRRGGGDSLEYAIALRAWLHRC